MRNNDNLTNSLKNLFNAVRSMSDGEKEAVSDRLYQRNMRNSFNTSSKYEHPGWKSGIDKNGFIIGSRNSIRSNKMEALLVAEEEKAWARRMAKNKVQKPSLLSQLFGVKRMAFAC